MAGLTPFWSTHSDVGVASGYADARRNCARPQCEARHQWILPKSRGLRRCRACHTGFSAWGRPQKLCHRRNSQASRQAGESSGPGFERRLTLRASSLAPIPFPSLEAQPRPRWPLSPTGFPWQLGSGRWAAGGEPIQRARRRSWGRPRQGCRGMGLGRGTGHWRLRSKRLLDCEQGPEAGREVQVEGRSRSAASGPTEPGATIYWLAVLWAML